MLLRRWLRPRDRLAWPSELPRGKPQKCGESLWTDLQGLSRRVNSTSNQMLLATNSNNLFY